MGIDMFCISVFNGNKQTSGKPVHVWQLICFYKSPALGFFYAGLARAKNALSLMYLTVLSVAVVSFQVDIVLFFSIHLFKLGFRSI
jgi:ammonia channel protein AmtB